MKHYGYWIIHLWRIVEDGMESEIAMYKGFIEDYEIPADWQVGEIENGYED